MTTKVLPSLEEMQKQLAALQARNAELEAEKAKAEKAAAAPLRLSVGNKGGVAAYIGKQRFPVTLYSDQWGVLLDHADMLREFIKANAAKLAPPKAKAGTAPAPAAAAPAAA